MFTDPRKIADSTTAQLGAGATYTGAWVDALKYRRASVVCSTDSATTIVRLEHGVDTTGNGLVKTTAAAAGTTGSLEEAVVGRYVRLVVVAGATLQTRLNAQLILS